MAAITLTFEICDECRKAILRSCAMVGRGLACLVQPEAFLDRFPRLFQRDSGGVFDLADDFSAVLFGHGICGAAAGAGHGLLSMQPSELFGEFMAALALQGDFELIDVHGWPVLSLVGGSANLAEAGGVSNLSGGGVI